MKPEIIDLLRNPSDELTRLLIKKHVSDVKLTFSVIERYRPIVKNAITDALLEMFRQGIVQQPVKSEPGGAIPDIDLHEEINVNTEECEQGPGKKQLPKMGKLFERGLIRAGEVVYLKNHPQEKAKVINEKEVSYKSKILSFNQWGQQVTGWKSINIYDWVIVEGQTETLSVLRRIMLLEQKSKLI